MELISIVFKGHPILFIVFVLVVLSGINDIVRSITYGIKSKEIEQTSESK